MDISNMKNVVVLKNLNSNLVEEAIVVLKKNQKIKNQKAVVFYLFFHYNVKTIP